MPEDKISEPSRRTGTSKQREPGYWSRYREARKAADPEYRKKVAASEQAYRESHKAERNAAVKRWYQANKTKAVAQSKLYYEANKPILLASMKAYREANKPKVKATMKRWRESHREAANAIARNYDARKRFASGTHTSVDIKAIWDRQKHKCAVPACQHPITASGKNKYHVDHVKALINGGSNGPENLAILCSFHNVQKSSRDEYLWAQKHGRLFM